MKSVIEPDRAGKACFASKQFGDQILNGYYSDKLINSNCSNGKPAERRFGEAMISVNLQ